MANYKVFYDAEEIDRAFKNSPFRLKKDIKGLDESQQENIATAIANELISGFGRPSCIMLYQRREKWVVGVAKIRSEDKKQNRGKSNGFRCIVLVDTHNKFAFLLHLFTHSKKDNISREEHNSLKKLVDEYIESITK